MHREFKLPDVGEGLTEAEILHWYVNVGDSVAVNQMICEIETAKAAVELPSPYAGTVIALNVEKGATVDVGTVIITIDDGEGVSEFPNADSASKNVLVGYGVKEADAPVRRSRRGVNSPKGEVGENIVIEMHDGPVMAKPPVRKLAKDLGVDIRRIRKSGNITRTDVLDAALAKQAPRYRGAFFMLLANIPQ